MRRIPQQRRLCVDPKTGRSKRSPLSEGGELIGVFGPANGFYRLRVLLLGGGIENVCQLNAENRGHALGRCGFEQGMEVA